MAYYGLSNPYMAPLNATNETYSNGFRCGKAISTSVTPNMSTASLFADNSEAERVDEFVNATVAVGTDRLPAVAASALFGHTVSNGEETDKDGDANAYVGYGFYISKMEDGKKSYKAALLTKVSRGRRELSDEGRSDHLPDAEPEWIRNRAEQRSMAL